MSKEMTPIQKAIERIDKLSPTEGNLFHEGTKWAVTILRSLLADEEAYHAQSTTPSTTVEQAAKEYAGKVMPFVWPKNKEGEDMVQPVGHKNPPFSARHRKEQQKIINAFLAGAALASTPCNCEKYREALDKIGTLSLGWDEDPDIEQINKLASSAINK